MLDAALTLGARAVCFGLRGTWRVPDTFTLPLAERLRAAMFRQTGPHANWQISGKDEQGQPRQDHAHLYLLPLASHESRQIDRIVAWANTGMLDDTRALLDELPTRARLHFVGRRPLSLESLPLLGLRPLLGHAPTWVSATPFVPPRHTKRRRGLLVDSPDDQLAQLCERVLGHAPARIEPLPTRDWSQFVQRRKGESGPDRRCSGWRITFDTELAGPIALGLGAHFGLGRFDAETHA